MFLASRCQHSLTGRTLVQCRRVSSSHHSVLSALPNPVELPTRHSLLQPPPICKDLVELHEETQRLLETPVGKLYATQATANATRDDAYDAAYSTIQFVEYLQLGHASQIPGSLYHPDTTGTETVTETERNDLNTIIESYMKPLVTRMQEEGEMYLELQQKRKATASSTAGYASFGMGRHSNSNSHKDDNDGFDSDEAGYLASDEDNSSDMDGSNSSSSSSSSSDSDSDSDSSDEESDGINQQSEVPSFAPPGATIQMQEALLDAMACVRGTATPTDFYLKALDILKANDLDQGTNLYTTPSHVTYNAALRGISRCGDNDDDHDHDDKSNGMGGNDNIFRHNEELRDEALSSAFALYNHLTHSLHLPRNSATFVYMLNIIEKVFPASRVRGNISVTLWDHASTLGVVDAAVIKAMQKVHEESNGPEFNVLLDEIPGGLPQKYRRFVNKYRHSDHY